MGQIREACVLSNGDRDDYFGAICATFKADSDTRWALEQQLKPYSDTQLWLIAGYLSNAPLGRSPHTTLQRALAEIGPPPGADDGATAQA